MKALTENDTEQLQSKKLSRNVICGVTELGVVFLLLEKPIKQYKASILIIPFPKEKKKLKMDEITEKQAFANKCSGGGHASDCIQKPTCLSSLGRQDLSQPGSLEREAS